MYGKVFKMYKVYKYIPIIACRCSLKWFLNFDFMKKKVENVCSSSVNPNIWTITIFASLKKKMEMNALRCEKLLIFAKVEIDMKWSFHCSNNIRVHGNLELLDYISRPLVDKMNGQIVFTSKDVLESKSLTSSKHHLV